MVRLILLLESIHVDPFRQLLIVLPTEVTFKVLFDRHWSDLPVCLIDGLLILVVNFPSHGL